MWVCVWLSFGEIYSGNSDKTGELQFQHFSQQPDYLFNGVPVSEWTIQYIAIVVKSSKNEKEKQQQKKRSPDVTLNGNDHLCLSLNLKMFSL